MSAISKSDRKERGRRLPGTVGLWAVAIVVALVTAYPPLASLYLDGAEGAFRFFADDTFYYLSVADRSAASPFFTFDGVHPTNGFHPLWQVYLERSFSFLDLDSIGQVLFTAGTSIALVTFGTVLFSLVVLRMTRRPWLALLASVPGFYYLAIPTLNAHLFAQWSFANGMESPLSVAFFGLLLAGLFLWGWLDEKKNEASEVRFLVLLSFVLTGMVLSRLDDVFIFLPFALWVWLRAQDRDSALRRLIALTLVPTISIGLYLAYNFVHAESLLPSSGAAKAQPFWAFFRNLYALWTTALPFADPLGREVAPMVWKSEAWRILQMLVPALAAAAWLLCRRMSWRGSASQLASVHRDTLLGVLASYVLIKAAYNFSMVGLWNQGHWYYPLSIMTFNLILATWFASLLDRHTNESPVRRTFGDEGSLLARLSRRWPTGARWSSLVPNVLVVAIVLVSANGFVDLKQSGRQQSRSFEFWLERTETRRLLEESCPECGVLAFDDGIVAYSLGGTSSTLNGLGLVMDEEAQSAQADGQLLEMAWARGHRMLVSVNYAMPEGVYQNPERLRSGLRKNPHLAGQDISRWNFEVAFQSPHSGVSFIRFKPNRRLPPAIEPPTRWAKPARRSRPVPATPAPATTPTTRQG